MLEFHARFARKRPILFIFGRVDFRGERNRASGSGLFGSGQIIYFLYKSGRAGPKSLEITPGRVRSGRIYLLNGSGFRPGALKLYCP